MQTDEFLDTIASGGVSPTSKIKNAIKELTSGYDKVDLAELINACHQYLFFEIKGYCKKHFSSIEKRKIIEINPPAYKKEIFKNYKELFHKEIFFDNKNSLTPKERSDYKRMIKTLTNVSLLGDVINKILMKDPITLQCYITQKKPLAGKRNKKSDGRLKFPKQ